MQDEEIDIDGEGINGEDEEAAAARDALEIIAMKARVAEMEQEAAKLREMNAAVAQESEENAPAGMSDEEKEAVDSRSIYVGNVSTLPLGDDPRRSRARTAAHRSFARKQVDYESTPEEIQAHFASCGTINRVTILNDKYTGPKG